jgi:hypothetical protein
LFGKEEFTHRGKGGFQVLTKIMKWITMAALLTAAMLWRSAANSQFLQFLLGFVVCFGAGVVVMQALRAKKFVWAVGFAGIALLFNPLVPVLPFDGEWGRLLVLVSIVPFAVSLAALRTHPLLSIASITGRNPGSESL